MFIDHYLEVLAATLDSFFGIDGAFLALLIYRLTQFLTPSNELNSLVGILVQGFKLFMSRTETANERPTYNNKK